MCLPPHPLPIIARRLRCPPTCLPRAAKLLHAFKDTAETYHENGLVWRTVLSGGVEAGLRGIGFASKQQMAAYDEEQVGGWRGGFWGEQLWMDGGGLLLAKRGALLQTSPGGCWPAGKPITVSAAPQWLMHPTLPCLPFYNLVPTCCLQAALAPDDWRLMARPSGMWLVLTVQLKAEQNVTISRKEDGQIVAQVRWGCCSCMVGSKPSNVMWQCLM
jgi:hypothetical protein